MISKEQWDAIAFTLRSDFCFSVKFRLDGHEIKVQLCRIAECELAYVVSVDGKPSFHWREEHEEFLPVYKKICRLSVVKPYAKSINNLKKQRGGKAFLKSKDNTWLHEKRERWLPWFKSVKSLVSQYRKIDGLELLTPETELNYEKPS